MMSYELFKEIVEERFSDFLPNEFRDYKIDIHPSTKVNQTLDAINLIPTGDGQKISPSLFINDMYEDYKQSEDLRQVLGYAASDMVKAFRDIPDKAEVLNFENARDNIVMALVNTEQNKEMLAGMPNREFQDLSIIYRWVLEKGRTGMASSIVTNQLTERMGMDEAALYKAASINTKRLFPPTVKSMDEVIREMFIKDGMPAEIAGMMTGETPPDRNMYVISNESCLNGAASMLYEEGLHTLAEKLETDLYILPSSIHEGATR